MAQVEHNAKHGAYNNILRVRNPARDTDHPVFTMISEMYPNDLQYAIDPDFVPYHNFPQRSIQQQQYTAAFGTEQMYHDVTAYEYPQPSPSLRPQYAGSPELHAGPFHSSLSSASGQSASSSNVGSPYSNHATLAPWPQKGLALQQPSIAGDDFGYNYGGFGGSAIEQHDLNFADVQKPIGFVGECASLSASWSSLQPPMSTSTSSMLSMVAQSSGINSVTPPDMPQVGSPGMRPQPMSPPSVRRLGRTPFPVTSDSSRAWHREMTSSRRTYASSPLSAEPSSASSAAPSFKLPPPPPASPFFSQSSGHFLPPFTCPDPSIFHQSITVAPSPVQQDFPHSIYPPPQSPAPSDMSSERSFKRIKSSQSPYLEAQSTFPYAYAASGPISMSPCSPGSASSLAKNQCPFLDCGRAFKDLKAHMLTHQLERPEKCPIATCDYHVKGFARKYDKNRHTLTHYKGTMVCGFCPGSGSSAEKSFNRADVFKRHLTSVHYVEQVPPNAKRKASNGSACSNPAASKYASDATGKCSTCSAMFKDAQDFYEHLDECVLRLVQQEEPSEAINAKRLAEVEDDRDVHDTLRSNNLPTATSKRASFSDDDEEDAQEQDDAKDGDYGRKSKKAKTAARKGGAQPAKAARKKRKEYPSSWGCPPEQMKTKKRTLCVFDGRRRLMKDEMSMASEYEVRVPTGGADARTGGFTFVTDMDVNSMKRALDAGTVRRAEALHNATEDEKGPWLR